ncbi:MAG TPA: alpha-amylase family glycosyl hydrolase [bacterium]|nr:alpha-amylase family glycosyl hydrolase [bacterium]
MNPLRAVPHPLLIEVSARTWIRRVREADGPAGLDGVPDAVLEGFRREGYHGVWLMGAWTTGPAGIRLAREHPSLRAAYDRLIPGWTEEDVGGSPFSIRAYEPGPELGGWDALARFRARLHSRGMGLMLDFVPNHVACDHPWTVTHPDRLVQGSEEQLQAEPDSWYRVDAPDAGSRIFAHGRDPHFPGWTDTAQVDYRKAETRAAMLDILRTIARNCDGVRCDVAMLLLPDVIERTWGTLPDEAPGDFWRDAIEALRAEGHDTVFLAEAYWGTESRLIRRGFDYAYDKGLYDDLLAADAEAVRRRVAAPAAELARGAHFLENHDEQRAAATLGEKRRAAAAVTFGLPGMRFFHDGQDEGHRLHVPVQLARAPEEETDEESVAFHHRLRGILSDPAYLSGEWSALDVGPAGPDDPVPPLIAGAWRLGSALRIFVANVSGEVGRARIPLPVAESGALLLHIRDDLSGQDFERDRSEVREPGLFVELGAWGAHFLRLEDPGP